MKQNCPNCQGVLYNRRLKHCGFCGAPIPEELRFTAEEIAALDRQTAEMEAARKLQEMVEEAARKAAREQPPIFIPIIISS